MRRGGAARRARAKRTKRMKIDGRHYRTIFMADDGQAVLVIDQTKLPFALMQKPLRSVDDAAEAIRTMVVRGAPLIGATAAYGVALAMRVDSSDSMLERAIAALAATRPTAVNLHWALGRMARVLRPAPREMRGVRA